MKLEIDPLLSATLTVTGVGPPVTVGVPVIWTVLVLLAERPKPAGRPVGVQVNGAVPPVDVTVTE